VVERDHVLLIPSPHSAAARHESGCQLHDMLLSDGGAKKGSELSLLGLEESPSCSGKHLDPPPWALLEPPGPRGLHTPGEGAPGTTVGTAEQPSCRSGFQQRCLGAQYPSAPHHPPAVSSYRDPECRVG